MELERNNALADTFALIESGLDGARETGLGIAVTIGGRNCTPPRVEAAYNRVRSDYPALYWNSALTSALVAGNTSAALAWPSMMLCITGDMMDEISDA